MPGKMPGALCELHDSSFSTTLTGQYHNCSHFTDEEGEGQQS